MPPQPSATLLLLVSLTIAPLEVVFAGTQPAMSMQQNPLLPVDTAGIQMDPN